MKELFRVPAENLAVDFLVERGDIVLQPTLDGEVVVYDNLKQEAEDVRLDRTTEEKPQFNPLQGRFACMRKEKLYVL